MAGRSVVVLGGGVGGLAAANALRSRLSPEHRITLVEKTSYHAFPPSFVWVMFGERTASQVTRPLLQLVKRGVQVVAAEAVRLDLDRRRVETTGPELTYDYLVIALGAELAPDAIPGLAQAGGTFYHLAGAARLAEAIRAFAGGTIAIVVARTPFKCPSAPHEVALLLDHYFRRKKIRHRVDVISSRPSLCRCRPPGRHRQPAQADGRKPPHHRPPASPADGGGRRPAGTGL